uniref:Methyltransferase type 11 domain-containing protein n=1 Tax=viral metagenome TaxID=1070528 RepID=A0A6C0LXG7_9ZZZZ
MKIHLGCGRTHLEGWLNLDWDKCGNEKTIIADLRKPLNFSNNVVDFIFSEHVIEHFTEIQGYNILKEAYRILKKGGVFRVICPDLELYLKVYQNWNDSTQNKNIKQLFNTKEQWLNYAMIGESNWRGPNLLCKNTNYNSDGHKFIYTTEDIKRKSKKIGFSKFNICKYRDSRYDELKNLDSHGEENLQLIIELTK